MIEAYLVIACACLGVCIWMFLMTTITASVYSDTAQSKKEARLALKSITIGPLLAIFWPVSIIIFFIRVIYFLRKPNKPV